ncbi:MAG TPA: hypothetical protein VK567_10505, partial [Bradyrhizobium sp.]|nr:hypothetical protein [Bradyrhizobium sp.]
MKAVIITLALAGLASAAPVDAQILGTRLPTPATNTNASINGSWQVVGRDGSGNTIYERRTQDRNGNIVVQRARRDSYGNMSIISTNTVGNTNVRGNVDGSWQVVGRDGSGNTIYERRTTDRNGNIIVQRARRDSYGNMQIISTNTIGNNSNRGNNCAYNQSTNTVGDIIFGRTNTNVNCDDVGNRVDGGWYQVGQGRDNNSIYERRVRDSNGNLVIQRARRNSNGSFTIISSRGYNGNSDKQWQKAQRQQQKEMRKQQKEQDKQYRKGQHDGNDDNRPVVRADDRSY